MIDHFNKGDGLQNPWLDEDIQPLAAIIAAIARATLAASRTPWEEYTADYDRIRDKMAESIAGFEAFIWAAFLIGAVLAGAATQRFAAWTLLPPILILLTLAAFRLARKQQSKARFAAANGG